MKKLLINRALVTKTTKLFLLLFATMASISIKAKVIDLPTMGTSIDKWTIANATLNVDGSNESTAMYTYDVKKDVEATINVTAEPNVVFSYKNSSSDKDKAFAVYPGKCFQFSGKNGVLNIKNTAAGDIIKLTVAAKGSGVANFQDAENAYPKNASAVSEDLTLPAKENGAEGADEQGYIWKVLEYVSLGGEVQIKEFANGYRICKIEIYKYHVRLSCDPTQGVVSGSGYYDQGANVTISATPNFGYHFVQWSDGNMENPRTITLTQDTTFEAIFAPTPLPDKQVWPIILDSYMSTEWQQYIVRDFRANDVDGENLYIWGDNTYYMNDAVGLNFFGNTEGYLSLVETYQGWGGFGIHISNTVSLSAVEFLRQAIIANPQDYYLHIGIKSTDDAAHAISIMNLDRYDYIVLGNQSINDGTVYQDFERDGEWHEFYIPMTLYTNALESVTLEMENFIFGVVSEGIARAQLNLDAVYFCNKAFKDSIYHSYTIQSEDKSKGWVQNSYDYLEKELTFRATPNYGYHFVRWSDSVTDNPRTIYLTQDTTITAFFAHNPTITYNFNSIFGSVSGDTITPTGVAADSITFSAIPYRGYCFVRWADGNTDNPRTIYLDRDTTMTAIFDYQLSGKCGKDSLLDWTLDTTNFKLNITGSGALSENYTYGPFIQSLTVGNEVTQIGQSAFAGFNALKNVVLGSSVKVLEQGAFYGCSAIDTIICYSQRPPTVNDYALYGLDYSTIVYVPAAYLNNYVMHDAWGLYDVRPMGMALTLSANNTAYGTLEGAGTFAQNATVTFSANPNYGYHFAKWSDGNTENPRTIVLTQDTAFTAIFDPNKYAISVTCNNAQGHVDGTNGEFDYLSELTYTAVPNYGYHFTQWSDGVTINPRTLTLRENTTLTAEFAKNTYSVLLNCDEAQGQVAGAGSANYMDAVTISATAKPNYVFAQWSDGNTDNPRTIVLTQDTTFTAIFEAAKSGECGHNNALRWAYDGQSKTLTITGRGVLDENYTYGVEAPTQMKVLIIGNEVTAIGERAFYGMNTINHLTIGGAVASIGDYAFAECNRFDDITCFAYDVPEINATTFANVGNKQYIYLYVQEGRQRAYLRDVYWSEFDVQVKDAETVTQSVDDVLIEPSDNTADVTWPTNDAADTYSIVITKNNEVVCTLIFNSNGQLAGIAFAPGKNDTRNIPSATKTANGFRFTITGLDKGTNYHLMLDVKNASQQVIASYSADFETTGKEQIPTGLDNTGSSIDQPVKILRDGQIYILRGEKTYTATGQEIK